MSRKELCKKVLQSCNTYLETEHAGRELVQELSMLKKKLAKAWVYNCKTPLLTPEYLKKHSDAAEFAQVICLWKINLPDLHLHCPHEEANKTVWTEWPTPATKANHFGCQLVAGESREGREGEGEESGEPVQVPAHPPKIFKDYPLRELKQKNTNIIQKGLRLLGATYTKNGKPMNKADMRMNVLTALAITSAQTELESEVFSDNSSTPLYDYSRRTALRSAPSYDYLSYGSTLDSRCAILRRRPARQLHLQHQQSVPHATDMADPTAELENLFDDDDDIMAEEISQQPLPLQASYSDPEVMLAFYSRLFPYRYLFQWLNHSPSPTKSFTHREFAFTLQNDAYLRYLAFSDAAALKKDVLKLNPSRFEIGPVYTANPRDRKTLRKAAFRPIEKEFVVDIDMTDYDEIRTCCSGAEMCKKCWGFITMAIKTIDVALRDDFGFEQILWVYSGRRGAHAWVCDERARNMDDAKRRAIATFLEVIKGGSQSGKKVDLKRPLHPSVQRSLDILKDDFRGQVLEGQDPWREEEGAEKLLRLLPDRELCDALRKKWNAHTGRPSINKWADIDAVASSGASKTLDTKALMNAKQDIVLEYTYPRLDAEVSKHTNHLLKSPFCVHPKTGRVCVPIDSRRPEEFDPESVPTVTQLLKEIDEWKTKGKEDAEKIDDWEKTSLKPYVEFFRDFVSGLMKEEVQLKKRAREEDSTVKVEF
ncbi:hypothetical protein G7K_4463-t1 [Saitoella complicata NRRL Y-17804]|uniref:DNA primase n=1 Tax=Saitoella complicata (strain BCRC 22490 / CBS 7301 / JCM 7358 / NBRC 10748 / NRRL Y-17804) TaxID=698492 RepID=A0A0E9NKF9_SAICN|nr:hypothetical protein G7K_4463-t1 [Saitoella complicata NRRL Y-17804]